MKLLRDQWPFYFNPEEDPLELTEQGIHLFNQLQDITPRFRYQRLSIEQVLDRSPQAIGSGFSFDNICQMTFKAIEGVRQVGIEALDEN